MPQDQLVDYIKNNIDRGYSHAQIRKVLVDSGYSEEEIRKAYDKARGETSGTGTKKKYILIVGAVAFLTAFVFLFMTDTINFTTQGPNIQDINVSCENLTEELNREACRLCKKIDDSTTRYSCLAMVTRDGRLCRQSAVSGPFDCYLPLALKVDDISYCAESSDRELCEALVTDNYEKCKNVEEDNQIICDLYFAYKENDTEFLKQTDTRERNYFQAFLSRESVNCNSIENEDLRRVCLLRLSVLNSDPSPCMEVETDTEFCRSLAERDFSKSMCQSHPSLCILSAIFSRESSICEKVPQPRRDVCYNYFVITKFGILPPKLLLALAP